MSMVADLSVRGVAVRYLSRGERLGKLVEGAWIVVFGVFDEERSRSMIGVHSWNSGGSLDKSRNGGTGLENEKLRSDTRPPTVPTLLTNQSEKHFSSSRLPSKYSICHSGAFIITPAGMRIETVFPTIAKAQPSANRRLPPPHYFGDPTSMSSMGVAPDTTIVQNRSRSGSFDAGVQRSSTAIVLRTILSAKFGCSACFAIPVSNATVDGTTRDGLCLECELCGY
jgi:hypothetical protein